MPLHLELGLALLVKEITVETTGCSFLLIARCSHDGVILPLGVLHIGLLTISNRTCSYISILIVRLLVVQITGAALSCSQATIHNTTLLAIPLLISGGLRNTRIVLLTIQR